MKSMTDVSRAHVGKLFVASAVCLLLFSGVSDSLAINTYVRDLKGMAVPVQTYPVQAPIVALTFDVGAETSGRRIGDVLLSLQEQQVKATFFLTGSWVEANPRTAQAIVAAGHEVGQSLYHYRSTEGMTVEEVRAELERSDAAWVKAGLPEHRTFRVPYGETTSEVAKEIRSRHEELISWSIDAAPNSDHQAVHVFGKMGDGVQPGDIIRLRVDALSAKALPGLLKKLREIGYEVRPVSSMGEERGSS
jgi:peptidoglycan/xylan/chitin deacetylase (PgdA/CDA1 family)